jgi:hypothetical protein
MKKTARRNTTKDGITSSPGIHEEQIKKGGGGGE